MFKIKNKKQGFTIQSIIYGSVILRVLTTISSSLYMKIYERSKVSSIQTTYENMDASRGLFRLEYNNFNRSNSSKFEEFYINKTDYKDKYVIVKDKTTLINKCSFMLRSLAATEENYSELTGLIELMKNDNNMIMSSTKSLTRGSGTFFLYSNTCSQTIKTAIKNDFNRQSSFIFIDNINDFLGVSMNTYSYDIIDAKK